MKIKRVVSICLIFILFSSICSFAEEKKFQPDSEIRFEEDIELNTEDDTGKRLLEALRANAEEEEREKEEGFDHVGNYEDFLKRSNRESISAEAAGKMGEAFQEHFGFGPNVRESANDIDVMNDIDPAYDKNITGKKVDLNAVAASNYGFYDGEFLNNAFKESTSLEKIGNKLYFINNLREEEDVKFVRTIDLKTKEMKTIDRNLEAFNLKVDNDYINKKDIALEGQYFSKRKLAQDENGNLYCIGVYTAHNEDMYEFTAVYRLTPKIEYICGDFHNPVEDDPSHTRSGIFREVLDFFMIKDNKIFFSNQQGGARISNIMMYDLNSKTKKAEALYVYNDYRELDTNTPGPKLLFQSDAIYKDGNLYIFNTACASLYKLDIAKKEIRPVNKYLNYYSTVFSYGDDFYITKGMDIYKLNINGEIKKVLNGIEINNVASVDENKDVDFDRYTSMYVDKENNCMYAQVSCFAFNGFAEFNEFIKFNKIL